MPDDTTPPARTVTANYSTLLVTLVLLAMAFWITLVVLRMPNVPPVLVTAIVTAWISGVIGSAAGFWLGSSVGGRSN